LEEIADVNILHFLALHEALQESLPSLPLLPQPSRNGNLMVHGKGRLIVASKQLLAHSAPQQKKHL